LKLLILYYWLRWKLGPRWRDRTQLLRWQARQLARYARWLRRHSPYYRTLLEKGYTIDSFPEVDKKAFMAHFNAINTVGIDRDQAMKLALKAEREEDGAAMLHGCAVGLSTGTSGNRGLFLASKRERAEWAATMMHRVLRPGLRRQRIAFILRANSQLYESIRSRLFEFRYYDLPRHLAPFLAELNGYQPHVLTAQPSVLRLLAEAQQRGDLAIHPEQMVSYAEVLEPDDRQVIESTFGLTLTEVYQATEGFIAATCAHGTLHLNEDIMRIERDYLSEGRFQPILTDFRRRSQPVVRYRLNDILVEASESCPCGSPLQAIARIEGRMDDVFFLTGKQGKPVTIFPDWVRRCMVRSQDQAEDYVVCQTGPSDLSIYLSGLREGLAPLQAQMEAEWQAFAEQKALQPLRLTFFAHLPTSTGIKRRRIIRSYADE